jgi:hypothetical protein
VFLTNDSRVGRGEEKLTKKVNYNKVFSEFVSRYKKLFQFKTIFDCFENREKETIDNRINYLILLSKKIGDIFTQVNDFDMFQNNPFLSQNLKPPPLLLQKAGDFSEWMMKLNKYNHLVLNYSEIMSSERSLSELLKELSIFHLGLQTRSNEVSIDMVGHFYFCDTKFLYFFY